MNMVGFKSRSVAHGRIHRDKGVHARRAVQSGDLGGHDPLIFSLACLKVPDGVAEQRLHRRHSGRAGSNQDHGRIYRLAYGCHAQIYREGESVRSGKIGRPLATDEHIMQSLRPESIVKISNVMHRNDPILLGHTPTGGACSKWCYLSGMIWKKAACRTCAWRAGNDEAVEAVDPFWSYRSGSATPATRARPR